MQHCDNVESSLKIVQPAPPATGAIDEIEEVEEVEEGGEGDEVQIMSDEYESGNQSPGYNNFSSDKPPFNESKMHDLSPFRPSRGRGRGRRRDRSPSPYGAGRRGARGKDFSTEGAGRWRGQVESSGSSGVSAATSYTSQSSSLPHHTCVCPHVIGLVGQVLNLEVG